LTFGLAEGEVLVLDLTFLMNVIKALPTKIVTRAPATLNVRQFLLAVDTVNQNMLVFFLKEHYSLSE